MTQQPPISALLEGGPYQSELRVLSGLERYGIRVPIPSEPARYVMDGEGPPPAGSVKIEVGEYKPTNEYRWDAAGREHRVYRYEGPDRLFMCTRPPCVRYREKVSWRRYCQVCRERNHPLPA